MSTSKIKASQTVGLTTTTRDGRAFYAALGVPITLQNSDGSGSTFQWTLVARPNGPDVSRVSAAVITNAASAIASITPDVPGSYRIKQKIDGDDRLTSYLVIAVKNPRGWANPAYGSFDGEVNFPEQTSVGHAGEMDLVLDDLEKTGNKIDGIVARRLVAGSGVSFTPDGNFLAHDVTINASGGLSDIPVTTLAGLGSPATAGRLRTITDYNRGLWKDNGSAWNSINAEMLNVRDFGATGNATYDVSGYISGHDDLPAFQAAIDAATMLQNFGGSIPDARSGLTVLVPPGVYRLNGTLNVNRGVRLMGAGGATLSSSSKLVFDSTINAPAIHVVFAVWPPVSARSGDYAIIENLDIHQSENTVPTSACIGIYAEARCAIINCGVSNFGSDGIRVRGDTFGSPVSNANCWKVVSCVLDNNAGHGFTVFGGDSNAGLCEHTEANGNHGHGIYDRSFLGNTYVGCHTSGNTQSGYRAEGGTNQSTFVGCYQESDSPPAEIGGSSMWIGGTCGNGFATGSIRFNIQDMHCSLSTSGSTTETELFALYRTQPLSVADLLYVRGIPQFDGANNYMVIDKVGHVSVGNGRPLASSVFTVEASDSFHAGLGSRPWPVLTTTQRDAISSPAEGLTVYNVTTHQLNIFNGTAWKIVTMT